jgi:hypothetical protein
MRLKRWESPRKEGRNDKGRGGSARQRQLKKQRQMLRKRLQEDSKAENSNQNKNQNKNNNQGGENISSPYFLFSLTSKTSTSRSFHNKNIPRLHLNCCRTTQIFLTSIMTLNVVTSNLSPFPRI